MKLSTWISDTSTLLEEYTQCVSKAENLKALLRTKARCGPTVDACGKSVVTVIIIYTL